MPPDFRRVKKLSSADSHFLTPPALQPKWRIMSTPKDQPRLAEKGLTEADARRRRQAEALRANLARRKAQSRDRDEQQPQADDEPPTGEPPADG
jgi:hypothetical protein